LDRIADFKDLAVLVKGNALAAECVAQVVDMQHTEAVMFNCRFKVCDCLVE
jgi:hypothetical protein